MQQRDKAL